jgi:prophage regulatory protein
MNTLLKGDENMLKIPEIGFIRLREILELIPVSKSTWWAGVKSGRFPKSVKLTPRTTAWKVEDIRKLIGDYGYKEDGSGDQKVK